MTNATKPAAWPAGDGPPLWPPSGDTPAPLDLVDHAVELPISDLNIDFSPRRGGLHPDHVEALAELEGRWPPILVARQGQRVVDGLHRVAAARRLGHTRILAKLIEASQDEAYVASIRCNVEHGLPLTLAERKDAANQILQIHPSWSDRRLAAVCGLSPGTLGTIRARQLVQQHRTNGNGLPAERRIGRDGRSRPVNTVAAWQRVAEAIVDTPELSLRKISASLGASPETVRAVRAQFAASPEEPGGADWWQQDAALVSSNGGRQLVAWLSRANIDRAGWNRYFDSIPMSRAYNLAAEARRRAAAWNEFADELEFRVRNWRS